MSILVRVALTDSKEKSAIYLSWIGFILVIVGLFLPWGTYERFNGLELQTYFISGFATSYGFFLIIGALAVTAGLLSSTVKPSSASIAFLGTGTMATILITSWFLLTYYYQQGLYPYTDIQNISIGSFITFAGGIVAFASAVLYSLRFRTPTSEERTQASSLVT